ncbi:MAG: hypothetical protein K0S40_4170 [Actinomycetospora sp.]|nr:hypothetical protein [Actinomycetospora sp.]
MGRWILAPCTRVEPDVHALQDLDDWLRLLRDQHGVVTRAQLLARGFTDHGIRAQLDAGRWQALHDGVFLTCSGPATPDARRIGALLACRSGALLSHETAGELYGFVAADPSRPIHVTVRNGASAVRDDDVKVHRSRAFAHIAAMGADPPRTTRGHTVLDLVIAAPTADEAMQRAFQFSLDANVHPAALERAAALRHPTRYRRVVADAVALLRDGVLSALEHRYLVDVERAHGLPEGHRQRPVPVDGVLRYEDIAYDLPGARAIVRLDGFSYHRDAFTALVDRRRTVAAMLARTPAVPFGWDEVTKRPCRTAREVEAILTGLGWDGRLVPCPRCS